MNKDSQHNSPEIQQWPPISYEELVWHEDAAAEEGAIAEGEALKSDAGSETAKLAGAEARKGTSDGADQENRESNLLDPEGNQGASIDGLAEGSGEGKFGFGSLGSKRSIKPSSNRSNETHYQAALPLLIAERSLAIPDDLSARISAILVEMARFDVELAQRADNVPTMLLRSESAASSQIDRLTSTAQSVALAELYPKAPTDARLVVANMAATEKALQLPPGLTLEGIVSVHDALIDDRSIAPKSDQLLDGKPAKAGEANANPAKAGRANGNPAKAGEATRQSAHATPTDNPQFDNQTNSAFEKLRQKPVWLGGTSFTPHTAQFVPPAFQHVPEYLADLIEFGTRSDLNPVVKAAILYAQFETVHPFLTANGPTGRALVHHIFREEGVLSSTLIPVSVGFLHNIDSMLNALHSYREGNPVAIIEQFVEALEVALFVSQVTEASIESVLEDWDGLVGHRKGSKIRLLPKTLVKQPVVNSAYLADSLGVTQRTATTLILRACEYGMLRHMGKRQRGDFYQSDAIIRVLDEINEASTFRTIRIA